jgi:[protein-PII] uridylyltransferase
MLWDLGQKVGHATRARSMTASAWRASDMTVRTAILEARYLTGDKAVSTSWSKRFDNEVVPKAPGRNSSPPSWPSATSATAKMGKPAIWSSPTSRTARAACATCNTLFWIGKYFYRVRPRRTGRQGRVLSGAEYRLFQRAEDFLWAVRCHLHFLTGRRRSGCTFDIQRDIADRLGYTSHPACSASSAS